MVFPVWTNRVVRMFPPKCLLPQQNVLIIILADIFNTNNICVFFLFLLFRFDEFLVLHVFMKPKRTFLNALY